MTGLPDRLQAVFQAAQTGVSADDIPFVRVEPSELPAVARRLRDEAGYGRLLDLTAVDDPLHDDRFELQYLFYSMAEHAWLRLKVRTAGDVPSITSAFPAANWYERELFDLFGLRFAGHPNLVRILMPDDWQGHPLRRDEPLGGEPVDFVATRDVYGTGA